MKIPYFDAHCDTPVPVHFHGGDLHENAYHLDLKRLTAYAPRAQVFAVCVHRSGDIVTAAESVLQTLLHELDANRDMVRLCTSAADLAAAEAEGKLAALISIEGAEQFGCDMESLRALCARGVRIVHITWNEDNVLCGSVKGSKTGLTAQGRQFVTAAQALGVVLDMSHISEQGFWDVLEIAEKPVLAGHSDSLAVWPKAERNLSDAQFRALVASGGVAGLNFCRGFLGLGQDIAAIVAHAEHYLELGGEKAVCLGTDFDGINGLPDGIEGVQSMGELYNAFLRKNWSEELVRDIFYNNLRDFFGRVL